MYKYMQLWYKKNASEFYNLNICTKLKTINGEQNFVEQVYVSHIIVEIHVKDSSAPISANYETHQHIFNTFLLWLVGYMRLEPSFTKNASWFLKQINILLNSTGFDYRN